MIVMVRREIGEHKKEEKEMVEKKRRRGEARKKKSRCNGDKRNME